MYDHGFSTMEKSHQRTLSELKVAHLQEIDRLRLEKEELLQSEALDTQAGLSLCRWIKFSVEMQIYTQHLLHYFKIVIVCVML